MNKKIKLQVIEAAQKGIIVANGFLFSAIKVLADAGQKLTIAKYRINPPGPAEVATCEEQAAEALAKFLTDVPDAVSSCPDNQPSADTYVPLEQPIVDRFAKERNTDPGLNNQRIKRVERATF